ncbi:MAG: hypothetical protein Q8Q54_08035 [Methylococcales bacterium]|nr:hypothetical protein [Methylococcales bacterium]MDP3332340.1 hypothetical protein [Methylococcaceae bacterium]MDP3838855.1 hypothetical protein [Methylococcales bacterium]
MTIQHNPRCLVITAICLTTLSLPSYAWQAARGSQGGAAARGNYGGAAVRAPSGAAAVRTPSGNTAYRAPNGNTAYHGGGAYHPPVPAYGYRGGAYYNDNHYSGGQVAGAAAVGLAVGAMAGSAAAKSQPAPAPTTVVVEQQPASYNLPLGSSLTAVPAGCAPVTYNYTQYFQCGQSWLRAMGSSFQVVPPPY